MIRVDSEGVPTKVQRMFDVPWMRYWVVLWFDATWTYLTYEAIQLHGFHACHRSPERNPYLAEEAALYLYSHASLPYGGPAPTERSNATYYGLLLAIFLEDLPFWARPLDHVDGATALLQGSVWEPPSDPLRPRPDRLTLRRVF